MDSRLAQFHIAQIAFSAKRACFMHLSTWSHWHWIGICDHSTSRRVLSIWIKKCFMHFPATFFANNFGPFSQYHNSQSDFSYKLVCFHKFQGTPIWLALDWHLSPFHIEQSTFYIEMRMFHALSSNFFLLTILDLFPTTMTLRVSAVRN